MEDRVRKIKEGVVKASFFSLRNIDWSGDVMEASNSLIDLEDWDKHKNQYLEQHINGYHPDTTTEERLIFENERLDSYEASLDTYEHELRSMVMKYRKMLKDFTVTDSKEVPVPAKTIKLNVEAIAIKYALEGLEFKQHESPEIGQIYGVKAESSKLFTRYTKYINMRMSNYTARDTYENDMKRVKNYKKALSIMEDEKQIEFLKDAIKTIENRINR